MQTMTFEIIAIVHNLQQSSARVYKQIHTSKIKMWYINPNKNEQILGLGNLWGRNLERLINMKRFSNLRNAG